MPEKPLFARDRRSFVTHRLLKYLAGLPTKPVPKNILYGMFEQVEEFDESDKEMTGGNNGGKHEKRWIKNVELCLSLCVKCNILIKDDGHWILTADGRAYVPTLTEDEFHQVMCKVERDLRGEMA